MGFTDIPCTYSNSKEDFNVPIHEMTRKMITKSQYIRRDTINKRVKMTHSDSAGKRDTNGNYSK